MDNIRRYYDALVWLDENDAISTPTTEPDDAEQIDQPTTQAAEIKNPKPATIQTTVSPAKDDSIDGQAPQKKDNGEQ